MFLLTTSTSTFLNVPYAAQVQQYLIRNPTVECFSEISFFAAMI